MPRLDNNKLMVPDLAHLAFVHHDDLVGPLNWWKTMGDDHGGAALHHCA